MCKTQMKLLDIADIRCVFCHHKKFFWIVLLYIILNPKELEKASPGLFLEHQISLIKIPMNICTYMSYRHSDPTCRTILVFAQTCPFVFLI